MTTSKLPILSVLERKDSAGINQALATYREGGLVNHQKTLAIPFNERIPELIKQENGRQRVSAALAASLLSAFGNISNAKMSADQIIELAEGIIDSSHEDFLSIEDVLLFLKDLLMGKMGKITEKLDMPYFFELFEKYRDKRYQTFEAIQYEKHLNRKNMGNQTRTNKEWELKHGEDTATMLDLFSTLNENGNEVME